MPIDYNTISYYYSHYLSNFGETVVQLIRTIPLLAKKRSNNTNVSEKQQPYKLVLAFPLFAPGFLFSVCKVFRCGVYHGSSNALGRLYIYIY